jgi:hypothetical protein
VCLFLCQDPPSRQLPLPDSDLEPSADDSVPASRLESIQYPAGDTDPSAVDRPEGRRQEKSRPNTTTSRKGRNPSGDHRPFALSDRGWEGSESYGGNGSEGDEFPGERRGGRLGRGAGPYGEKEEEAARLDELPAVFALDSDADPDPDPRPVTGASELGPSNSSLGSGSASRGPVYSPQASRRRQGTDPARRGSLELPTPSREQYQLVSTSRSAGGVASKDKDAGGVGALHWKQLHRTHDALWLPRCLVRQRISCFVSLLGLLLALSLSAKKSQLA